MQKLGLLTAAAALTMALAAFGLAHPAGANHSDSVVDSAIESPESLDIIGCSAVSDGSAGATGEITVTMTLNASVCSTDDEKKAHWRIHYDYTGFTVEDQTPGADACERGTTSDDTSMVRCRNNLTTRSTGPGANGNVTGAVITFVVEYDDLMGRQSGDEVFIWCDTQRKGFVDAAPDRDGGDGCNKPESTDETLEIILD